MGAEHYLPRVKLATPLGDSFQSVLLGRWKQFAFFLLAPAATMVAARMLMPQANLSALAFPTDLYGKLCKVVECIPPAALVHQIHVWSALTLVLGVVSATIVGYVIYSVMHYSAMVSDEDEERQRQGTSLYWLIAVTVLAGALVSLGISIQAAEYKRLFPASFVSFLEKLPVVFDLFLGKASFHDTFARSFLFINTAVAFAAVFIVSSVSFTITNVNKDCDARLLTRQRERLTLVLYFASLLLVVGVIQIGAWTRLPAAFLDQVIVHLEAAKDAKPPIVDDPKGEIERWKLVRSAYQSAVGGYVTFSGATFMAILLVIFLPASKILSRIARTKAEAAVGRALGPDGESAKAVDKWLEDRALTDPLSERLKSTFAVIAPLIAGPLADLAQPVLKI